MLGLNKTEFESNKFIYYQFEGVKTVLTSSFLVTLNGLFFLLYLNDRSALLVVTFAILNLIGFFLLYKFGKAELKRKEVDDNQVVNFNTLVKISNERKTKLLLNILLSPNRKKIKVKPGLEFTPINNFVPLLQFMAFCVSLMAISFAGTHNPFNLESKSGQSLALISIALFSLAFIQTTFIYRIINVVVYVVNNNVSNDKR